MTIKNWLTVFHLYGEIGRHPRNSRWDKWPVENDQTASIRLRLLSLELLSAHGGQSLENSATPSIAFQTRGYRYFTGKVACRSFDCLAGVYI
jgi:hypothetical protein